MSSIGDAWRQELLCSVDSVNMGNACPGTIVIYSQAAHGILAGSSPTELIGAAAELGSGRVLAFSHDDFSVQFRAWAFGAGPHPVNHSFQQLLVNAYKWLLKGQTFQQHPAELIVDVEPYQELNPSVFDGKKVAVWSCRYKKTTAFVDALTSFVRNGGGLFCGCTPWGYQQLNPNDQLSEIPSQIFLQQCGISYTDRLATDGPAFTTDSSACDKANLQICLSKVTNSGGTGTDAELEVLSKGLPSLPSDVVSNVAAALTIVYGLLQQSAVHATPTITKPVTTAKGKAVMNIGWFLFNQKLLGNPNSPKSQGNECALPGTAEFPGTFACTPACKSVRLNITAPLKDFYPTGLYAPPGVDVEIQILKQTEGCGTWMAYIGCHMDFNCDCSEYSRWPDICAKAHLRGKKTTIRNMFGGGIYLYSPKSDKPCKISLCFSNVVESPLIDITDSASITEWADRKKACGLWADMCGRYVKFTVPSNSVRDLVDPVPILRFWDRAISAHYELKGTDINRHPRQWIVYDVQPCIGHMHSGYPIVASLLFDIKARFHEIPGFPLKFEFLQQEDCWGILHEMGHNMQEWAWTFEGTTEVTCNIFTLHAMDCVVGIPLWIHPWVSRQLPAMREYLNSSCSFTAWKANPGIGIGVYAQLAHHFGWAAFKRVFRAYAKVSSRGMVPPDETRISFWIMTFSKAVCHNIMPMYDFWGVPVSETLRRLPLPMFLPDDEMTRLAPQRVAQILQKYPDCKRVVQPLK